MSEGARTSDGVGPFGHDGHAGYAVPVRLDVPKLLADAESVLRGNWTGRFTRPSAGLYPHQWSWDSGFIAIGLAHLDPARAMQELRSLFLGQWDNGLLPHIVFHEDSDAYFPGPAFWQVERSPHAPDIGERAIAGTSGIVQPPIHATAVRHVLDHAGDRVQAERFLRDMFPRLRAWHDYLYRERGREGQGLVAVRHPWESGQDNSPLWDGPLARVVFGQEDVPPYERRDLAHVDAGERPRQQDYDRYVFLVAHARARDYDEARVHADAPFLVQDVLFNTLLCRAERDLAALARALGEDPAPFEARAERTARAMDAMLWDDTHAIYLDRDVLQGELLEVHTASGFTPLFAGVPDDARAERLLAHLDSAAFCQLGEVCYAVPSYDREADGYSPRRYWRGPVWVNINWLLHHGLQAYGYGDLVAGVRRAVLELPQGAGFWEYYDPEAGRGLGSQRFSWSAALALDLLHEEMAQGPRGPQAPGGPQAARREVR